MNNANNHSSLYRISVKGGILSPAQLLNIIDLARQLGLDGIHFGSRQDILLNCSTLDIHILEQFPNLHIESVGQAKYSNIVCSYASAEIFQKTPWLTGATYLYILEQFTYPPKLEININDPFAKLSPLFTGHLNFIAAEPEDFWFCYIRLPDWEELIPFPALIHSWDLAKVAQAIEEAGELATMEDVVTAANRYSDLNLRNVESDLVIPFEPFPYYEGMNRQDANTYWLGLYWRNNWYDVAFLEATCQLCLKQRIGKICITSWKSFIISGIPAKKRLEWEKLLGRFGINVRHSSLELNWHLPVADRDALNLKRYLVRAFDQRDISTYGLTFGISSVYSRPFTSIVIEPEAPGRMIDGYAARPTYNVHHAQNFDPNSLNYIEYARQVDRSELVELMEELSRLYFAQLDQGPQEVFEAPNKVESSIRLVELWQCQHCYSVYDPALGEAERDIPSPTPFASLPDEYTCWTCGAPKADFREMEMEETSK